MLLGDGSVLQLKPHVVAYCPPDTEHDVRNTGDKPLRYLYVVARA
jgi:oxalate decarboxylase/phosphoglucose isomerase-like protein (cupin superfamily)